MSEVVVLKISDALDVYLNEQKLGTAGEVAHALEALRSIHPDLIISIEADASGGYEAIGKAIYGSQRVGFSDFPSRAAGD